MDKNKNKTEGYQQRNDAKVEEQRKGRWEFHGEDTHMAAETGNRAVARH